MTTALDSSVIVAALASWHERHDDARGAVAALLDREPGPVVPNHALVEAFSVFTRMPPGYRVSPRDARDLLQAAFHGRVLLHADPSGDAWELLELAAESGVAGGAVYDLRIVRAARAAGARRLLTLNPSDFERFAVDGVEVVEP